MKTIVVLTDFSERAEHAAMYALHLAKKIKANVVLYSVCPLPFQSRVIAMSSFLEDDEQETITDDSNTLILLADRLKSRLKECSFPGTVLPEIAVGGQSIEIVDAMTWVINNDDVVLIVTSPGINNDLESFLKGDDCRKIVDWSNVPVLVVPEFALIRNLEKIAFVSESATPDTNYINLLVAIVEKFSPEIMVANLETNFVLSNNSQANEKMLSSNIYEKIKYSRIYHRTIPVAKQNGWQWLKDNKRSDMLVMVQKPKTELKEFFKRAQAAQVTYHITIPVLIFPAVI